MEMRHRAHGSESGQTLVEYALILVFVALLATVIFLSGAIKGVFGSTSNLMNGRNPPTATEPMTPPVQWPTSVQQCLNGGWQDYPQFTDQASCVQYVTGGG
jgi:Flp pilus assembly pilin Flp